MFRCAVTGKVTEPREPMFKVVIEQRPKQYDNIIFDDEGKGEIIYSKGWEIVKEICVSAEGLALLKAVPQ
jgi:hypothetical protein